MLVPRIAFCVALTFAGCRCSKDQGEAPAPSESASNIVETTAKSAPGAPGLSAPIAAAHFANGDVIVAGIDVAAKALRVQRISPKDEIVVDRTVLSDITWTTDADLKLVAASEGAAITWRGLRGGKLVRQLVVLGADLAPRGEPAEVASSSCATRDALWFSDGTKALARPWSGAPRTVKLPHDKEASLLCSARQAFAVVEDDDHTSLVTLTADAGPPAIMMREKDFGEDEQRELSEYTVGEDVGMVRLGRSGALALREITNGALGPLRKAKTAIRPDDDVVAVDASGRIVLVVYTSESGEVDGSACTKVAALRIDRQSLEESTIDLAPAHCGTEVGPFFTSAVGEAVSVAWAERQSTVGGRPRAPIVGLAHATVPLNGAPVTGRIEQAADALVDAGCDGTGCFAAALARREGADAMVPGFAKVLRYR